jgi:hypothetical protein
MALINPLCKPLVMGSHPRRRNDSLLGTRAFSGVDWPAAPRRTASTTLARVHEGPPDFMTGKFFPIELNELHMQLIEVFRVGKSIDRKLQR